MPPPATPLTIDPAAPEPPAAVRRELVGAWALAIGGIALAWIASAGLPVLRANLAGVAAFLFIVIPERRIAARGERWRDYGLPWFGLADARTWRAWARGAGIALLACVVIFPVFVLGFWAYGELLPRLPPALARVVAPYHGSTAFTLRLPGGFAVLVVTQLLVVALPEELFYRGWMQGRWAQVAPGRGVTILGARLGAGFVATQALFALGHLVVPQPWRLGTFLPALLFGWLRARTGSLAAPVVAHAISNVFITVLEHSFYGP